MKLRIFNYAYYNILENEYDPDLICPVLIITGRTPDGIWKSIKVPGRKGIYRPHFYVEASWQNRKILTDNDFEWEEWPYPTVYDEKERVFIVYTQFPYEVTKIRGVFEHTYEADVPYEKMFIMKLNLEGGYLECPDKEWVEPEEIKPIPEEEHFPVKPRIFYFDIETDIINQDEDFGIDNVYVISLVVYDNYLNQYDTIEWSTINRNYWKEERTVKNRFKHDEIPKKSKEVIHHCVSEKQLLQRFFDLFLRKVDAIWGFNSHGGNVLVSEKSNTFREWRNGFDEPVIHKRALTYGLERDLQKMSPIPAFKNKFGNYYGVYNRGKGDKYEVVVRGLTPLDFYYAEPLMQYTAKYRDFFGRSLDAYLKYFSNYHKVEHEGLTVAELKKLDLEKELLYNRIDVEGCLFLDKRFGFSDDIFDTVSLSKVPGIDVLKATKIHDFIILDESQDYCVYDTKWQGWSRNIWEGWLHEKKDEWGIVMKKHRPGGFNVRMKRGISGWFGVLDFSGFYPTLASSANAGIDTLIQVEEEWDDFYVDRKGKKWTKKDCVITPCAPFRKDKISIEKRIWDKLLNFRQKYKDKYAEVLKEYGDPNHPVVKLWWSKMYNLKTRLVNNKYGASGNYGFRNYCFPVYSVPPTMAQICIQKIVTKLFPKISSDFGIKIEALGGDTDSVFIGLPVDNLKDAILCCNWLVRCANIFIDELLDRKFNIQENIVNIGWEKIGPQFYGHKKKNYMLNVWAEDGEILTEDNRYIVYKGFEMKKGNRADVTELVQRVYFQKVRESKNSAEFLDKITKVIKNINKIFPYISLEKICQRINIRKQLDRYSESYMARRGAETANNVLGTEFGVGNFGYLAWLKGAEKPKPVVMFKKKHLKHESFKRKVEYDEEGKERVIAPTLDVDYDHHKQKFVISKLDYLLDAFNTSYWRLLKASKISSPCVL